MTCSRILAAVILLAFAAYVGLVAAVAYVDDFDWPLGPKDDL